MNRFMVSLLARRGVQRACARALVAVPSSHKVLQLVQPPGREPFVAFVAALRSSRPDAATTCAGWTVHELTAHLTAGTAEIADLIELELSGEPSRPTRDFEERELPYRSLTPGRLRREFFEQALRATVCIEQLRTSKPPRQVEFTGVSLDSHSLMLHMESELVLHRWDITGTDATSMAALSDPRYGLHAVTTVAGMKPDVFPRRSGDDKTVILRTSGAPDIVVTGGASTSFEVADGDPRLPVVECQPAVRNLLLWGRWPAPGLPEPTGEPQAVASLVAMLRPKARAETVAP